MDINLKEILLRGGKILFRDLDIEEPQTSRSLEKTDNSKKFMLTIPSSSRPVYCSKKVIDSSSLLKAMLEHADETDPGYVVMM